MSKTFIDYVKQGESGPEGFTVVFPGNFDPYKEARLMSAAPKLLVACEAIVHATKMDDSALGAVAATLAADAIRDAIE